MRTFIIEREIPEIGCFEAKKLKDASAKSNKALAELAPNIKWLHSYVAANQTFCVYLAKDKSYIEKHSELSGFPANRITEVIRMIDPSTAD